MKACVEHQEHGSFCPYCVIEYLNIVNRKHKDRIKKLTKELLVFKAQQKAKAARQADKNF
jgi:hypothetical protein